MTLRPIKFVLAAAALAVWTTGPSSGARASDDWPESGTGDQLVQQMSKYAGPSGGVIQAQPLVVNTGTDGQTAGAAGTPAATAPAPPLTPAPPMTPPAETNGTGGPSSSMTADQGYDPGYDPNGDYTPYPYPYDSNDYP